MFQLRKRKKETNRPRRDGFPGETLVLIDADGRLVQGPAQLALQLGDLFERARREPVLPFRSTLHRDDGTPFLAETSVVPLVLRGEAHLLALTRDVTERRAEEEKVRKLLSSISELYFRLDREWNVRDVNDRVLELLGKSRAEVVGKSFWEVVPDLSGELAERYRRAPASAEAAHFEGYSPALEKWVEAHVYPGTEGIEVFLRDITDRKQAEEELQRSNRELEQFASVASHDLQEPLRVISAFIALLDRRYGNVLDEAGREYIAFALDGAKRMKVLMDDLLGFSRLGRAPKELKPVEMNEVMSKALANLSVTIAETDARITKDPLPTLMGDAVRLGQLLQNLVGNAIKFRGRETPKIHVGCEKLAREWKFSISDNGIGLDMAKAERIFEVFQRLHGPGEYPGTGLGLAVCRKIVERHGGRIWVDASAEGKGSVFCFTIPARPVG